MSIGQRISELRKQHDLSQYQLAKLLEVSRQAVSKWENDQAEPDALHLIRLADLLDTDLEYLSTGRRNFSRRPPVVINTVETIETVVEKPIVREVEKIVERIIEKTVVAFVDKPIMKKVYRKEYLRNPVEFMVCGGICLIIGILIGMLL